ncbi:MAG: methyltransferase domain-containing protein [Phycisphaerales bacterium]|nr:methyltransferase domain-containing protein [Phycisphaerales bacterium]
MTATAGTPTRSGEEREYALGTHDAELARLGWQHDLWADVARQLWDRAGIASGCRVLDVGCGPGFATLELAERVGRTGHVIGVDVSPRYAEYLQTTAAQRNCHNVTVMTADVQSMPIPDASIDVAYCRWVLCWVANPAAVVRDIARVLRPGGLLAVQDYFDWQRLTLAPRSEIMDRVARAANQSYIAAGSDCDVVQRLPGMLKAAGLQWESIEPHAFAVRPADPLWAWPTTFFANYVPKLVEGGWLTEADQLAFFAEWAARSKDDCTFFCTPTVYSVIGRKPE